MKINDFYVNFIHNIEGRNTLCKIVKDDEVLSTGSANTCSADTYNKMEGRRLTLKRALSNGDYTKEERTSIWKTLMAKVHMIPAVKKRARLERAIAKELLQGVSYLD